MGSGSELVPCPGGCGNQLHHRAMECPHCGYRAEVTGFDALLGSLSTVSSILTGFGLAALVSLATAESERLDDPAIQWTAGLWGFSSMPLLTVLVLAEVIRRQEAGAGHVRTLPEEDERIWRRCERLLMTFSVALIGTAAGVIVLGFHFSVIHGISGALAAVVGIVIVCRSLR